MKKAIIIGASSGIGEALARILAQDGYALGLAARRVALLEKLRQELPAQTWVQFMDLSQTDDAITHLNELFRMMDDVDVVVISAGTGYINPKLDWPMEKETIDVNVTGFTAMANVAFQYFLRRGKGHIVGISSIAALRGSRHAPAYNASKAFVSNYLEGLRCLASKMKTDIAVTDIKPGLVDTAMAKGEGLFWLASPEKAARQIYAKIKKRKDHAYITKRWRIVALMMKIMPNGLYKKL